MSSLMTEVVSDLNLDLTNSTNLAGQLAPGSSVSTTFTCVLGV